jgi:hypothetical protein
MLYDAGYVATAFLAAAMLIVVATRPRAGA